MNGAASRHLDVETMAGFVEGTLAPAQLAEATTHLADCRECRLAISETVQFEREEEAQRASKSTRTMPAKWAYGIAAAIAALAITLLLVPRRNESLITMLIDAAPPQHRTVEPRLGDFPYRRLQAPPRGGVAPVPADLKFAGAAGTVLEKTSGQTTPESRHASGLASLVIGRTADAIASLEDAAKKSTDAKVWSDLAAARYVAAVSEERTAQLPLALAAADRALQLDPKSAEALFNRALILEQMELRDYARAAWQNYLAADSGSAWAVEARAHLQRIDDSSGRTDFRKELDRAGSDPRAIEAVVRTSPRDARGWAEGPLLAEWADAESAGDTALASQRLDRARNVAAALTKINGEQLAADAVAAIDRSSGSSRKALVDAHRLFRDARIDYAARRASHDKFVSAESLFRNGESPMAGVASYYVASTLVDENATAAAHDLLRETERGLSPRYRALAAQIQWELAICASIAGDWGTTFRSADAASAIFTALGETTNTAAVDGIAAYALERMGASDLAWSRRIHAIAALRSSADRARRSVVLHSAALGLEAGERLDAAASVIDLVIAERETNLPLRTVALTERARFAIRSGDAAGAREALRNAHTAAAVIEDPGRREMAVARIGVADATLLRTTDPRAALPALDRAIAYFTNHHADVLLADAYLQRARAYRSAGDARAAKTDLAAALREVGKQRRAAHDSDIRVAFLDTAEQIAEESIDLHIASGEAAKALDVAESLQSLLRADAPRSQRAQLQKNVLAIRYALLPKQLAIFRVSSDDVGVETVRIDRDELTALIQRFAERVRDRAPRPAIRADAAALYARLIAPVESALAGKDEIVVIPDRQLHIVPFAALYDETQRRFLFERYAIRLASSVAGAGAIAEGNLAPAAVIADPTTPLGPRLPASRREAEQIAALYRAAFVSGENATAARFRDLALGHALIHYSGHADSDLRQAYGALLLAPSADDRGILGSSEIARLPLSQHPLVVLAACGTARGEAVHIGGMPSLARAFLDAGARAVVGTLWEISDDVSSVFFIQLHQRLSEGSSPARALREAQTAMLGSADERLSHPATWAAVEVISN